MRFLSLTGFSVRPDKGIAFKQWLSENEEALRRSYPEGTAYVGIYGATFTSEKSAGELFWIETFETYSALDAIAAAANDPSTGYYRLLAEMAQFGDPDRGAGWSRMLLKNATEASWFDVPLD